MKNFLTTYKSFYLFLLIILFSASASIYAHRFHYVKWDATGFPNGSSWQNAFTNLQDALNIALANDTIFVAQGVYFPDIGKGIIKGDRSASFVIKAGVVIMGGYKGNEVFQSFESDVPGQFWKKHWRDWQNNPTILSGDLLVNDNDNVAANEATRSDNSYHVLTTAGPVDTTTELNGFIIEGGNANLNTTFSGQRGGGLYISSSRLQLRNCIFRNNSSLESGGGIYSNLGEIRIKFTSFINNNSKTGGAISFLGNDDLNSPLIPQIVNSTFYQNIALAKGAGVYAYNAVNAYITNCTFIQNYTIDPLSTGAGVYFDSKSYPEIVNVTFFQNSAVASGGGITLSAGRVSNSILRENLAANQPQIFIEGNPANSSATRTFMSSCVEGGFSGTDIIDVDPMFVNSSNPMGDDSYFGTPDDGLLLQNGSQLIDHGTSWTNIQHSDILGYPRLSNDIVDIGAYEHQKIDVDYRNILDQLRQGGFILLMRHAITDKSQQDQPGYSTDLNNCDLQRNLSNIGKLQCDFLWNMMKLLEIPCDTPIASPMCRTKFTARYVFSKYYLISSIWMGVDPQYTDNKQAALGSLTEAGLNSVYVTHQNSIEEVTSFKKGEVNEGDIVIIKPLGGTNFQEIAHFTTDTWEKLIKYAGDDPLPVELSSFTASVSGDNIKLIWTTASEKNNRGFEVERAAVNEDGSISWRVIGFIDGKGTSSENNTYTFNDKPETHGKYNYRLKQIDFDGTFEYSQIVEAVLGKKFHFALEQNYPNPFNPVTVIKYSVPEDGFVSLEIFNLIGERIRTLLNDFKTAGDYQLSFNAANLASGMYFYKITAGSSKQYVQTRKMILLR